MFHITMENLNNIWFKIYICIQPKYNNSSDILISTEQLLKNSSLYPIKSKNNEKNNLLSF